MNPKFLGILVKIAKNSLDMKTRIEGLEKMRQLSDLSFGQSLVFWGLTNIGSEQESWGRVAIINWFVPVIVDKTRTCTPVQEEIYYRILHSVPRDKELTKEVKEYLENIVEEVPPSLSSILREKFNTICIE